MDRSAAQSPSELTLDNSYSIQELVAEVFAGGTCETITNIAGIGSEEGIGYFEAPDDLLGFSRGIILSTGPIGNAAGPNNAVNTSGSLQGGSTDADLDLVADRPLFDRVGLEFDFVPLQSQVTFRYVFASEEFCEFAGTEYNDVFGFFVSGPGLNGPLNDDAVNVALIPGTQQPVAINTVNHQQNEAYYLGNELPTDQSFCDLPTTISPRLELIEYDGQTVVLTATLDLIACESYHLRMVISDVFDDNFDSAVFLEAGSFDLGGSVSLQALGTDTVNQRIFEGCEQPAFRFLRGSDSDINLPQTVAYRFGVNSSAIPGTDFVLPPGEITIPAGQTYADLVLETIPDGLTEGEEDIWLLLDIPCACYSDSVRISLVDPEPLQLELEDAYYCPDQTVRLDAGASGGSPPYSYLWSTGQTTANPELNPPLPASLSVQVSDACGQMVSGSLPTFSSQPPSASFPPQEPLACWGEQRQLTVELIGRPPFELTYRRSGNAPQTITFEQAGSQSWTIEQGGLYELTHISDQACNGSVSGSVQAHFYRPVINPTITHPTCDNERNGRIAVTHLPTVPPYSYQWSGTHAQGATADSLDRGQYGLTITDALGCRDERQFELRGPTALMPIQVDCNQLRRPPLSLHADGGQPPYTYSVDGETYFDSEGFRRLTPGNYYDVYIRDANGCELLQPDFFMPLSIARTVRLPGFIPQELGGSVVVEPDYLVPVDQIDSITWLPPGLFDCSNCRTPRIRAPASQTVSLVVTDRYGCVDSLSTRIGVADEAPLFVPSAFSPNGDGTNDVLVVYANSDQVERVLNFRMFTRWGELIFEDSDFLPNSPRRAWDGLLRGQQMPSATYVWIAEVRLTTGSTMYASGSTHLVR